MGKEVEDFLLKGIAREINFIREIKDSLEMVKGKMNGANCHLYTQKDLIYTVEQADSRLKKIIEDCEEEVKEK